MAINPFKRRFIGTPGFAGGTLEEQLEREAQLQTYGRPRRGTMEVRTGELEGLAPPPMQKPRKYYVDIGETPVHTKPGGLDMYSDLAVKQGERPIDAIRREDMQRAAIGQGDPVMPGSATFATNTELAGPDRRLSLDYVPTGERTRPRRVNEPQEPIPTIAPSFKAAFNRKPPVEQPTFEGKPILADQVNGELFGARPRRTQPRDFVADDAQYLRDLEGQPRNWKDKTVDVLDAISVGLGNKPRTTMTKREREIAQTQQRVARDMALEKHEQGDLVPVTLQNGEVVNVPKKSAAALASRQQEIGLRGDTLEARKKRWDSLSSNERRKQIVAEYKAGLLNNDPRALDQAARELNIPGTLLPAFIQGQMRDAIDDDGNLIEMNRQTGATVVGPKSYETVKEAGRESRADAGIASREKIASMPARQGAGGRGGGVDKTAQRRAATLIGQIERARREMEYADQKGDANAKRNAQAVGEQAAAELNALGAGYEAGRGEGGYPYYKQKEGQAQQGGKYSGKRISKANVSIFAQRHNMTPEEAAEFLQSEGATVY